MKKQFRIYAVMTDSGSWNRSGLVAAFDTKAQALDELRDLRDDGERWWIQSGVMTLKPRQNAVRPFRRKVRP